MSVWQILFSFEGRIRRSHWWLARIGLGFGFLLLLGIILGLTGGVAAMTGHGDGRGPAAAIAGLVFGLFMLVSVPLLIWTEVAITVKRWHDRDKPGVMFLIIFIPLIGGIWTLVECGFLDGTPGPNKYGPSPKGLTTPEIFA